MQRKQKKNLMARTVNKAAAFLIRGTYSSSENMSVTDIVNYNRVSNQVYHHKQGRCGWFRQDLATWETSGRFSRCFTFKPNIVEVDCNSFRKSLNYNFFDKKDLSVSPMAKTKPLKMCFLHRNQDTVLYKEMKSGLSDS